VTVRRVPRLAVSLGGFRFRSENRSILSLPCLPQITRLLRSLPLLLGLHELSPDIRCRLSPPPIRLETGDARTYYSSLRLLRSLGRISLRNRTRPALDLTPSSPFLGSSELTGLPAAPPCAQTNAPRVRSSPAGLSPLVRRKCSS